LTSEDNSELRKIIQKIALLNAIRYNGKAQAGPVMRKLLGEKSEYRTEIKELSAVIDKVILEINNLSLDEQTQIVATKWPEILMKQKIREEKRLPPLPNADAYTLVVTRYAPNPNCVLHLGSARAIVLCHEYARMYKGKFVLRFEDTDPEVKRPVLEFYDQIREDLAWLQCKPDEEYIQTDRMSIYYKYAEKLLESGDAYVCTCPSEQFRKRQLVNQPCECRNLPIEEHVVRWQRMFDSTYREGEAVVRVKTDLNHPNPAVRDWPAARVKDIEKYPHPRVGIEYRVWPLYNLACGIDDHLMGVTHIIRGKEHLTNQVRQEYMYKHLGWKYPEAIHFGRLKITGAYLSKSKIVQAIGEGLYKDWDDPRLATLTCLRRRGITPIAIKKMMFDLGPKTSDITLSWENLYAFNRKIVDPASNRYFFVPNPKKLKVKRIPKVFLARLHLHPDKSERGSREYTIEPKGRDNCAVFWFSKNDLGALKLRNEIRLMGLFNVRVEKINTDSAQGTFASESYEEARNANAQMIHWVPVGEEISGQVVMPDATLVKGIFERSCNQLKPNDTIQLERFGFVRIDRVDHNLTAYYTHK